MAVLAPSAVATASECDAIAGNLVQNCGFETGDFTDWQITGDQTGVVGSSLPFDPHSGSDQAVFGSVGFDDVALQTISTHAGTSYAFSYWLANEGGTPSDFRVTVAGVVGGPLTFDSQTDAAGFDWTQFTHTVTASTTALTITFYLRNDPNYYHLDDVSLVPTSPCGQPADRIYTGTVPSGILATSGVVCVDDATVHGGIVASHATLYVQDSTVLGGINSTAGGGLQVCGSSAASIGVTQSTGMVLIGAPESCAPNTITGSLLATGNHGGGTIEDNTISGGLTVTANTPTFQVSGNHK
jgi:hypothetical protein